MTTTADKDKRKAVVTVKALSKGTSPSDSDDKLLPGDILQEIRFPCGKYVAIRAPFHGLSPGLLSHLQDILAKTPEVPPRMLVHVHVLRLLASSNSTSPKPLDSTTLPLHVFESVTIPAFLIQQELKGNHKNKRPIVSLLHTIDDSSRNTFIDSTQEACIALQEMRFAQLTSQLTTITLKEAYVPYTSWESKMQQSASQCMVFSIVFFPRISTSASHIRSYANVDDTVTRAMAWFTASQTSGVPVTLLNIQTEPLLTKVSDQHITSKRTMNAVTWEDMCATSNEGVYGIEDYHGIDIGILRAVRLWFVPIVSEIPIVLQPKGKGITLGVSISRTEEGFCYVSSVMSGSIAEKAGLDSLLVAAKHEGRLLVISKVEEEKIIPTVVSPFGSVRCYDTMSISQKLATHWRLGQSIRIYVLAQGYNMDKHRTKETTSHHHNHRRRNSTQSRIDANTMHDCIETSTHSNHNSVDSHGNPTSPSNSILIDRVGSFSFRL